MSFFKKLFGGSGSETDSSTQDAPTNGNLAVDFYRCTGNRDLWSWLARYPWKETERFCRTIDLGDVEASHGAVIGDADTSKFQLVCFLTCILLCYRELREEQTHLGLPAELPSEELWRALLDKIVAFLREQEKGTLALIHGNAVVDLANDLLGNEQDTAAIEPLELTYPSAHPKHVFLLLAAYFNVAMSTEAPEDIARLRDFAVKVRDGDESSAGSAADVVGAKDLAAQLLEKVAEVGGEAAPPASGSAKTMEEKREILKEFEALRESSYQEAVDNMSPGEDPITGMTRLAMQTLRDSEAAIREKYGLSEEEWREIRSSDAD